MSGLHRDVRWALVAVALLAAFPAAASARRSRPVNRAAVVTGPVVIRSGPLAGGWLGIAAAGRPGIADTSRSSAAVDLAFREATRIADLTDPRAPTGELARLNQAGTERFACSPDLYDALSAAVAIAAETDGAYDPTCGPLLRARDSVSDVPAVLRVGWRMLALDAGTRAARFTRPGMSLELGPARCGWILDRAAAALRERGVPRARLELGGTVLAFTIHEPWQVTIPDPRGRDAMNLLLANAAVGLASSGVPAPAGSARVLDPRTGQPPPWLASLAVVARPAARAQALAQALLVMGRDGAEAFVRSHPEVGVLWLESGQDGLRAWAWNLGRTEPAAGLRVEWMTEP
jgi:thiamine biosynthesis lipoprotein